MSAPDLCFLDIRGLGELYRRGQTSPVEVVETILDRIDRLEGRLNAWITVCAEEALEQAKHAETRLRQGRDLGPLDGIPVSIKDNMDWAGLRTTCGSRILREHVSEQDATVVRKLRDAGAVLVGKNNLLEFAYGIVHPDFGQCNNPWDTSRTSGGSTSGGAAAVAAGTAYAALGTDTGGSIRIPASYCGIVGFKPSYGLVSRNGVFPLSWSLDHVGPVARTVEDAALVFWSIMGPDPLDATTVAIDSNGPVALSDASLRGVRAGIIPEHLGDDLRPGVRAAFEEAVHVFQEAGATLRDVSIPSIRSCDQALLPAIGPEATSIHEAWLKTRPEAYAPMTRVQLELGVMYSATDYVRVQRFRARLMAEFEAAFQQVDVVISPTVAWVAPAEDPVVAGEEGAIEARRTAPYNLTGLPAITLPCGTAEDGLPAGLQIAGTMFQDFRLLQVAHAAERRLGWTKTVPRDVRVG